MNLTFVIRLPDANATCIQGGGTVLPRIGECIKISDNQFVRVVDVVHNVPSGGTTLVTKEAYPPLTENHLRHPLLRYPA